MVVAGVVCLCALTPLAFGSVHPWAFSLVESTIFLMVALWMVKLILYRDWEARPLARGPLLLFLAVVLFQLIPLPPSVLRVLSPSTYELYVRSLPGWPEHVGLEQLPPGTPAGVRKRSRALLPTSDEVKRGASVPFRAETHTDGDAGRNVNESALKRIAGARWRPLAIAPSLTRTATLKLLAYAGFFLMVFAYPFGLSPKDDAERRFYRAVVCAVVASGLVVAAIALVQHAWWNGKILWFFVPYDWGTPRADMPHAGGPFVNPDHLANYLTMVLPAAIAGALCRTFIAPDDRAAGLRIFCGVAAVVISSALLLSLSRGGWIAALVAILILVRILRTSRHTVTRPLSRPITVRARTVHTIGFVVIAILVLALVGSAGRARVDARLQETLVRQTSLRERVSVWQDSTGMIRDFPLWGVGLGCWRELFAHYRRPPWQSGYFVEAHNDYLQIIAEVGIVGFLILVWLFFQHGLRLCRVVKTLAPDGVPIMAALVSALGAMAVHESVDFSLQIPANALLFTLFLALASRLAAKGERKRSAPEGLRLGHCAATGIATIAMALAVVALKQGKVPFPYNTREPASLADAQSLVRSHPASAFAHLSLINFIDDATAHAARRDELRIALWLDPNNPFARDAYARLLFRERRVPEGLRELTTSVFLSPATCTHAYLNQRSVAWLSPDERSAIEEGFTQARRYGYEGAIDGLSNFYAGLARFSDRGKLYEQAASEESDTATRVRYLLEAGQSYLRGQRESQAQALFRRAARIAPGDPGPYHYLATAIFAPRRDLRSVEAVIGEGIDNGADPFVLSLSLAEAAQKAGDVKAAEAALNRAVMLKPSSGEAEIRLGLLYLAEGNFDRAALAIRKAADLNPQSADVFYNLGRAEEGRYQYFAAGKAYTRALELDPRNTIFRKQYEEFQRKLIGADRGT